MSLFNHEDTSDMACTQGNEKIFVHKAFIEVNSKLLFERLADGTDINEDEKDTVKFLYTGKIDDNDNSKAMRMIEIANKLNLPLVKQFCETELIQTLTVENVLDRYIFASRNNTEELRKKAKKLIIKGSQYCHSNYISP